jgi:short-subunit dehydrogenase
MYSATQAFQDYISQGLSFELKEMNIDVLSVRSMGMKIKSLKKETEYFDITPE